MVTRRMPSRFGKIDLLPENYSQRKINPTQIIVHTAVDAPGPSNIPGYFARRDVGVESHLWLPFTGIFTQMMEFDREAHANRLANKRAISVETEDDSVGVDPAVEFIPWNDLQVDALIEFLDWACDEFGIPRRLCAHPDAPGLGFHRMWGWTDPYTPAGIVRNQPWSIHDGKTCPGTARVNQLVNVIIPALNGGARPPTPIPAQGPTVAILQLTNPILRNSTQVRLLQRDLIAEGFTDSLGDPIVADGDLGPATWAAMGKAQTAIGLTRNDVPAPWGPKSQATFVAWRANKPEPPPAPPAPPAQGDAVTVVDLAASFNADRVWHADRYAVIGAATAATSEAQTAAIFAELERRLPEPIIVGDLATQAGRIEARLDGMRAELAAIKAIKSSDVEAIADAVVAKLAERSWRITE